MRALQDRRNSHAGGTWDAPASQEEVWVSHRSPIALSYSMEMTPCILRVGRAGSTMRLRSMEANSMSSVPSVQHTPVGHCLRLSGVDWPTYSRLLRIFAERPGMRL